MMIGEKWYYEDIVNKEKTCISNGKEARIGVFQEYQVKRMKKKNGKRQLKQLFKGVWRRIV